MACQAPPPCARKTVAAAATKIAHTVLMTPVARMDTMVRRAAAGALPMCTTAMARAMATAVPAEA